MCSSVTCGAAVLSRATSRFNPLASFCLRTSTASCVATTKIVDAFERDQRAVGRYVAVAGILEHRSAARRVAVAVLADNSHTACQEPTSDQPHATGTTAARAVFSITA